MRGLRELGEDERRAKFEELAKVNEATLSGILKDDQAKRLKQISLQLRGARAFSTPEVATALGLTEEQKKQIASIEESSQSEMCALVQGGNREQAREKIEALRKANAEKVHALLTTDQQAKWKELTGAEFKGQIRPPA